LFQDAMIELFTEEMRRDPYPVYRELKAGSPVFRVPPPFDAWMILDYEGVKQALADHETYSSVVPGPRNWFIFSDPPAHTMMRALLTRAFTPRIVADLEPRLREIARELLRAALDRGEIDFAGEFSVPMAMRAIASIIGIPPEDWPRYRQWSDVILGLSTVRAGGTQAEQALRDFSSVTAEMSEYLAGLIRQRRARPEPDLLTRLIEAEVDGERLFHEEILGFLQLLVVAGQETTSDLINNFVLCLLENPDQLARLRADPGLMTGAVEETLRYRSPTQWLTRVAKRAVAIHGVELPAGALVMPVIGSANRDAGVFAAPDRFDIGRQPNPHIAFGHGVHFCLGAALSRLEARIAVSEMLAAFRRFEYARERPWAPRRPFQVLGPAELPVRFEL
jgi:cytochrome P450